MSILPIMEEIRFYNQNKPNRKGPLKEYVLSQEDGKKIALIIKAVADLKIPFIIDVMLHENTKQIYLKCTDKPTPLRKSSSLPEIKNGVMKV